MFNFLKKPAFGLDVSDYSIEIISLDGSLGNPRLSAMGRIILEPGIVENGRVFDKEKLKISLQNLLKKPDFGKIRTQKVIFSVPESKSFIHIFKLPQDLKKQQESGFIKSQAEQILPYPLDSLYLDFKINNKEVLLATALKDIVDGFLEVFKVCRLKISALDIESESLARSLIYGEKEIVLIADIGAKITNFNVLKEGESRLSISIDTAGDKFSRAISDRLMISFRDAENFKKEVGLNPGPQKGKVFLILQREIQEIIKEIRKIEEYFQEKEGNKIEKIILAGGSAILPCLSEYLTENLMIPVIIGDPWIKINIDILKKKEYFKKAFRITPILYASAVGSALRGLTNNPGQDGINLMRDARL